jgi:hypothetical protein
MLSSASSLRVIILFVIMHGFLRSFIYALLCAVLRGLLDSSQHKVRIPFQNMSRCV